MATYREVDEARAEGFDAGTKASEKVVDRILAEVLSHAKMVGEQAAELKRLKLVAGNYLTEQTDENTKALAAALGGGAKLEMIGMFAHLTEEQQEAALAYRGPENHGDPAFRRDGDRR